MDKTPLRYLPSQLYVSMLMGQSPSKTEMQGRTTFFFFAFFSFKVACFLL